VEKVQIVGHGALMKKIRPKVWEILTFLVVFFVGNLTKLQEMVLEGEISWVTNSHLGQQHRRH
jgi:hypothetical protein